MVAISSSPKFIVSRWPVSDMASDFQTGDIVVMEQCSAIRVSNMLTLEEDHIGRRKIKVR
jgi:hypothetical protein